MSEILIGLDLGTTVFKAAAFQCKTGQVRAQAQARLPLRVTQGGGREQSPRKLDHALSTLMRKLRGALGKDWSRVAGIGLASQGGSSVIADRRTGKPLTSMYLWSDKRSNAEYAEIAGMKPAAFWRGRTMRDLPGLGLGRMLWLKRNQPRLCAEQTIYAGAGEWVFHRLTGVWQQDACNALLQGSYNAGRNKIDPVLLTLANMRPGFVAPLRQGDGTAPLTHAAAKRLGLCPDIPVNGPYMDHEAGYMSASAVSARPLQCSLGTAWVGNFVTGKNRPSRCPIQLVIPAVKGPGKLVIQPLLTGNVTWDWGLARFVGGRLATALRKAEAVFAKDLLPPPGMCALPWLTADNPLGSDHGGAAFTGVSPAADQHDFLRALSASMAFEFYRVFCAVKEHGIVDSVVLGGGASKGKNFRALLATLFNPLPVYAVDEPDLAGARGAVFAFSAKTVRASTRRVRLPGAGTQQKIHAQYQQYIRVFGKLYEHVIAGGPIRFPGGGRSSR